MAVLCCYFSEQERGNDFLYHLVHGIKSWTDNTYESMSAFEVWEVRKTTDSNIKLQNIVFSQISINARLIAQVRPSGKLK